MDEIVGDAGIEPATRRQVCGIATLSVPPQTIAGELGPVLATAWALLFLLGGILGMATVLPGWWK